MHHSPAFLRNSLVIWLIAALALPCAGQQAKYKYDLPMQRLLLKFAGLYLREANQGFIDLDSAMYLSAAAHHLPKSYFYDEGYNTGAPLPGYDYLAKDDPARAAALLRTAAREDRLKLLVQLGGYYLHKPRTLPADMQNSLYYASQAAALSDSLHIPLWRQQSRILMGWYYEQAGDAARSHAAFRDAVAQCREAGNKAALANALDNYGSALPFRDTMKGPLLQEAGALYTTLGMPAKALEMKAKILAIHFWLGPFMQARQELYENLEEQKKIGFLHTQYTETTIAFVEMMTGGMNKAHAYALQSIQSMERTGDTAFSDYFYIRLGNIYEYMGRFNEAIALYNKSLTSSRPRNAAWFKSFLSVINTMENRGQGKEALKYLEDMLPKARPDNLLDTMLLEQAILTCLQQVGRHSEMETHIQSMIDAADRLKDPQTQAERAVSYSIAAWHYAVEGNFTKARINRDKVLAMRSEKDRIFTLRFIELAQYKIDSSEGKLLSAIGHYREYSRLTDSFFNLSKAREMEELQIRYETAQKEQSIAFLENESKLQKSALERTTLLRNITFAGVFLLLAFLGLLYNRYRLKQRTNKQLEQLVEEKENLLSEKEWLVREIHHRVKNNLQIVISLMNIQSTYLESGAALDAIRESQSRMNAMSLIHQKLYQSSSLVSINMRTYIGELVRYLMEGLGHGRRITHVLDVEDVELDVAHTVPLGLILNEAVTNSIKYAFPGEREGVIMISLQQDGYEEWTLTITDNGVGLPPGFDIHESSSIGMTLITTLTEQIGGILDLSEGPGLAITIRFKVDIPVKARTAAAL